MSQYQDRPGSGIFFREDNKKSERAPDFSGRLVLDDETMDALVAARRAGEPLEVSIAGWGKQGQSGKSFISMKVQAARSNQSQPSPRRDRGRDIDDEIPF